ncbi:MAG: glutamate racemase [Anaerolineales bacterium]|nr:glutamate racemase [Anaerolineales bacterium]
MSTDRADPYLFANPLHPIGIFDSGVGGLSVLREILRQLPSEDLLYVADQAHVPYGQRPLEEVRQYAFGITDYLLSKGAKIIVVACNTASAAALQALRQSYPRVPFVGMEPAVKPAAETTKSGSVGVLATPATFQGDLYASVIERFAQGVTIYQHTCPGLVQQIEKGDFNSSASRKILEDALLPMLEKQIDTVVLGCTHYPFVIPLIQEIVGEQVRVIDPAPAVARQTQRMLEKFNLLNSPNRTGQRIFVTSGNPSLLETFLKRIELPFSLLYQVTWNGLKLVEVA